MRIPSYVQTALQARQEGEDVNIQAEMLNLIRAMVDGLVADEATATELADAATQWGAAGCMAEAATLRLLSHQHRVRALKLQGQLAALSEDYASRFHDADG